MWWGHASIEFLKKEKIVRSREWKSGSINFSTQALMMMMMMMMMMMIIIIKLIYIAHVPCEYAHVCITYSCQTIEIV